MLIKSLMPNSISRQIFILVALSAILFHVSMNITFLVTRSASQPANPMALRPLADLLDALDVVGPDRQALLVSRFNAIHPALEAKVLSRPSEGSAVSPSSAQADLHLSLPPGDVVTSINKDYVTIAMPSGQRIEARMPPEAFHGPPPLSSLASATLLFIGLSVTLFLVWAIRNITAPLSAFAAAADRFTLGDKLGFLPESGPAEIRTASRAFNRMQRRIKSMMDDRTWMLAAIGHDLRTPVTRLRLRAEYIAEPALRLSVVSDLDHMSNLIQMALSFLRDERTEGAGRRLDLASMLKTICDEFADLGNSVSYDGPDQLAVVGEPDNLKRAVTNLVDNAVGHGRTVVVSLRKDDDQDIAIEVVDDGPGIPDEDKPHVFEPFRRGRESAMKRGGFGLGLSIVQAIVEKHNGSLSLSNGQEGGLLCRITLPHSCAISR